MSDLGWDLVAFCLSFPVEVAILYYVRKEWLSSKELDEKMLKWLQTRKKIVKNTPTTTVINTGVQVESLKPDQGGPTCAST